MPQVLSNFNGLGNKGGRPVGTVTTATSQAVTPTKMAEPIIPINTTKTRGTYSEILEIGKQNAKCEVDLSQIKIEGNPIGPLVKGEYKFDNSLDNDTLKIVELSNAFSEQIKNFRKLLKMDDEEDDNNDQKKVMPLEAIRAQMTDLSKNLRAISYVTICQMFDGILIDEKLSLRKGEAYEYKHQHYIYLNEFFNLIMNNKLEVYKKLGFEKSVLVEELLNRLIDSGVLRKKENDDDDNGSKKDIWVLESFGSTRYSRYGNDDFIHEWEKKNTDLIKELTKLGSVNIKLKQPFNLLNMRNGSYERLNVNGIQIKQSQGVNFLGKNLDWSRQDDLVLELDSRVYNYVYNLHEKVIKDVLSKAEYEMKKALAERQAHTDAMVKKCQKFLLLAKIMNIDVNETVKRY